MNQAFIKGIISKMSPDQKIGATLTLGMSGTVISPSVYESIEKYHCSGLRLSATARMFSSYIDPQTGRTLVKIDNVQGYKPGVPAPHCPPDQWAKVLNRLQEIAGKRRLGIPLHFSFDQEGGSSADFRSGGVNIFPKPMGIRAAGDPQFAHKVALATARQARAVGLNWIHSPVLDVNSNPRNPEISHRSYSDRVAEVIEYAEQSLRGFKQGAVIATAKHFPGRGDSAVDAHYQVPVLDISRKCMDKRELLPYKVLIEGGALPAIMLAHTIYPALDETDVATVSKTIITDLLRDELGFRGVITTDSMTMAGVAVRYGVGRACAMALAGGADLVLMKAEDGLREETFDAIRRYIDQGMITEKELDEKIFRILSLKCEYGLFESPGTVDPEEARQIIQSEEIIELSKEAALKSVLIARDRKQLLPLDTDSPILIIEQVTETADDVWWHSSMLFESCCRYNNNNNNNVRLLEIAMTADENDLHEIEKLLPQFETVIMTNFFVRSKVPNNELVEKIIAAGKTVVLVTNTPYELTIPDRADTVVVSLATSPRNMEVTAGVIFGKIRPLGQWPVAYGLPE